MKHKKYKLLFTVLLIFLFWSILNSASAQEYQTLISYPEIQGGPRVVFGMTLPSLIKYIYLFAVGVCGAIALMAILLGAIKYIGAAGNPSKMGDAKDQIVSAILGVVILLSSYLILYTINPDLVTIGLSLPVIETDKLDSFNRTDSYRCICRCEKEILGGLFTIEGSWGDIVISSNYITGDLSRLPWGADECKEINFGDGWTQCKNTCKLFVSNILFLQTGSICGPGYRYTNSALQSCTINQ